MSFLAPSLPHPSKNKRQIFVAYPYRVYDTRDYRKVFTDTQRAFNIKFVFADEKITDLHILQKINNYIKESRFSIFDISAWNPNVTLELGLALGLNERLFIALNPTKTHTEEVPSDLRGVDRIQYTSFSELSEGLTKLLAQEFPVEPTHEMESRLEQLRSDALKLVAASDGVKMGDIASALGVSVDLAKVIVRPLVGSKVKTKGVKKGAKYYPI